MSRDPKDVMVTVQVSSGSGARPAVDGPARALLPTISALARQAVPRLLEGVVIPLALFYAALNCSGSTARCSPC
ncbi:hypothetical protein [Nonomuraea endophytica]|uniref:hypothetical protein n=1 Tax=Nonomuraea endophytica TaxID=714136 RepID=UPI0037C77ED5